jgi:predicted O-methyltransferase YrrM
MRDDLMLKFIASMKVQRPDLEDVLDSVFKVYRSSRMQEKNVDTHYLLYQPGHYYSPLPSRKEFRAVSARVYGKTPQLHGVDLNVEEQIQFVERLAGWYAEFPYRDEPAINSSKNITYRYYLKNTWFCHADAYWLYAILREYQPKRIIEIGSGFSSAVMLDANDLFLRNSVHITFIEPNPERLFSLLTDADKKTAIIHQDIVQNIPADIFSELASGDILFIDSSHVAKIGSDVLHILRNILPIIQPGVLIHFHDIFYPFEYPQEWLERGRAWNECYMLNAFLQFNKAFTIRLFGNFLGKEHAAILAENTPLCLENIGGSLWLEKTPI